MDGVSEAVGTSEAQPKEAVRQLADLVVDYLARLKTEYVFGVPGGAIEPLYNALARSQARGGPRAVVARHEAGAAYMADGYARESGRLGVCCATTGPGATNLITGVASAFADRIPMLAITAQTALPHFGRGALQESSCTAVNTVGMFQHCTVYNTLVSHPDQLEGKLIAAVMATQQSPRGPAHISVPRDVLATAWTQSKPQLALDSLLAPRRVYDGDSLERLCELIGGARGLTLVIGEGCADAMQAIMAFAELTKADLVATPQGKAWIHPYHPQFRGVFGFAGHRTAREALETDAGRWVIAVGTALDEFATAGWEQGALLNERLIHIDDTPEHFARSPMAHLHLYGRIEAVFTVLTERARQHMADGHPCGLTGTANPAHHDTPPPDVDKERRNRHLDRRCAPRHVALEDAPKYRAEGAPFKPQRLVCELTRRFPVETRFVADAGNSFVWSTHYLHPAQEGTYHVAMGFGAMGWAVGAAVGVAMADRDVPVVCLTGDGSYLMSGQELTVAVQEGLNVVFVILNDAALGMVKHGQRLGGAEQTAFELPPVDFAAMARAAGAQGYTLRAPADFEHIDIAAICRRRGPTLLDVHIDGEEVPPMGMRMKTLGRASD